MSESGCVRVISMDFSMRYPRTYRYVYAYKTKLDKQDAVSAALIKRLRNDWPDKKLQGELRNFYQGLYKAPYQTVDVGAGYSVNLPRASVIECLKVDGVTQSKLAQWCGVSAALVTNWKDGTKRPDKYEWWTLALHIGLPVEYLPAFLMMVGCSIDPMCRQDEILLHGQIMGYSPFAIYTILEMYGCPIEKRKTQTF